MGREEDRYGQTLESDVTGKQWRMGREEDRYGQTLESDVIWKGWRSEKGGTRGCRGLTLSGGRSVRCALVTG